MSRNLLETGTVFRGVGNAREFHATLAMLCSHPLHEQPYTEYISTRWYRAPECLLTDGYYGYKMDMWGVGCVLFEILALYPLFPGENEMDQIKKIHSVLGTPPAEVLAKFKRYSSHIDFNFPTKQGKGIAKLLPHVSADAVDIIVKLLAYDPEDRISARQALRHPWFHEIRTAEKRQAHANAAQRTAKTASSASGRATTRSTVAAATGSSATGGAGSSSVGGSTGETGGGKTQPSGGAVASGTGASSSKGGDASAKAATTVGSDPGLPTIAKGGPAAGSGGKGAASKRHGGHPASSTIALPVSSSTAHASAGSSNSSNKRHHAHHHSTGAASTRRSGHGHHHAGSHASGGGFSHHHPHPRMPPSAAVDASLPPIGKPVYSSTLRVGGAKYHHHHGSHHHSGGAHNKRSGRKRNEYATARSKGGKYHTGRSKMSQTTATARTGGSTNKGGGGVPGKYLSPYSQKFIQKQRQN